jgi:hypothetical protein
MTKHDAPSSSKIQVSPPNSCNDGATATTIQTLLDQNTTPDDDDVSFTENDDDDDSPCNVLDPSRGSLLALFPSVVHWNPYTTIAKPIHQPEQALRTTLSECTENAKRVETQRDSVNLENTGRPLLYPVDTDESQNPTAEPDIGMSLTMDGTKKKEKIHRVPSETHFPQRNCVDDQVSRKKILRCRPRCHPRLSRKPNQPVRRSLEDDDDLKDTDIRIDTREWQQIAKRMRLEELHRANQDFKESSVLSPQKKCSSVRFKVRTMSLPRLLWHRETRGLTRGYPDVDGRILNVQNWQSQMLEQKHTHLPKKKKRYVSSSKSQPQSPESPLPKTISTTSTTAHRQWRPYCHRTIHFRELGTPKQDAVLGLDPTGSYVITLGQGIADPTNITDQHHHPDVNSTIDGQNVLCIRLFGVPAPSTLDFRSFSNNRECSMRPHKASLLSIIPLDMTSANRNETIENHFWNELRPMAPDSVPIHLWLSTDGCLGAALVRHDCLWNTENQSNLVLFPLPRLGLVRSTRTGIKSFLQLHNIHVTQSRALHDNHGSRGCNLLWKVDLVPQVSKDLHRNTSQSAIDEVLPLGHIHGLVRDAYLFLVDEDDGYRLTWVHANTREETFELPVSHLWNNRRKNWKGYSQRSNSETRIVTFSTESEWETSYIDTRTGLILESQNLGTANETISVCGTGFFSVVALLHDILSRRPKLVYPAFEKEKGAGAKIPTYSYHVVSVHRAGRTIEIFLVFSVGKIGAGCLGVYVEVSATLAPKEKISFSFIKGCTNSFCSNYLGRSVHARLSRSGVDPLPGLRHATELMWKNGVRPSM